MLNKEASQMVLKTCTSRNFVKSKFTTIYWFLQNYNETKAETYPCPVWSCASKSVYEKKSVDFSEEGLRASVYA